MGRIFNRGANLEAAAKPNAAMLENAVRVAQERFPAAAVKVRRGRVYVVDGDLIRLLRVKSRNDSNPQLVTNRHL